MSETRTPTPQAADRVARSVVYAGLSAMLAADVTGIEAAGVQLRSVAASPEAGDAARSAAERLDGVLRSHTAADLLRDRRALLPPVESRDLPAYESAYGGGDLFRQAQQMADVAGCYRAHGLSVGGAERERPDHIAVELEFMACLTAKEADALVHLGPTQVELCRESAALFLTEHLGRWGPTFAARLAERSADGLCREVADVLAGWIASELAERGVTARPIGPSSEPLPMIDAVDEGCGIATEGSAS